MTKKPWTQDEIKYLKEYYNKLSIKQIAEKLNRTYKSVQRKAQSEQLTNKIKSEKNLWSKDELIILERNYEKKGATYVANRLHRSLISVKKKAQSMNLNCYQTEYLSLRNLASSFQSDPSVIHRWIRHGLPCKTNKRGEITMYWFEQNTFWDWAKTHTDLIPWQKYIQYSILPEPEWIKPLIKNKIKTRNRQKITSLEIQHIVHEYQKGKSFKTIADELHRTEYSIKHVWQKHKPKNTETNQKKSSPS